MNNELTKQQDDLSALAALIILFGLIISIISILAWSPWINEQDALETFNSTIVLDFTKGEGIVSVQKSWIILDNGNFILGGYEILYTRTYSNGRFLLNVIIDSKGKVKYLWTYAELS